jgi:hypothetical protein
MLVGYYRGSQRRHYQRRIGDARCKRSSIGWIATESLGKEGIELIALYTTYDARFAG